MASVHFLSDYRRENSLINRQSLSLYPPPKIADADIFSRDFSRVEHIVFAVLKLREILRYHIHDNEEWQFLLLGVLDAAYHFSSHSPAFLQETALSLKEYILAEMTVENNRDMINALLLCDLVQKSPLRIEKQR